MERIEYRVHNLRPVIRPLGTRSRSSSITTRSGKTSVTSLLGAIFFCFAVLLFTADATAQVTGAGSIQGHVTDSTGALIPNASVTLTEASTHVTLTTKTSSGGDYAFPNINVGTYSVTVASPGFTTYTSTGNVLEVGSSIAVNAKMAVGGSDVKVEVRAESLALQTEDPSFKQTIDRTEVLEMPLNGRHMTDLVTLAGGSQGGSNPGDANGSKYASQSTGISIAGAPGNTVSYRLDGGDNNDYMGGRKLSVAISRCDRTIQRGDRGVGRAEQLPDRRIGERRYPVGYEHLSRISI